MKVKKGGFVYSCLRFVGFNELQLVGEPFYRVHLSLCKVFWLILLGAPFVAFYKFLIKPFIGKPLMYTLDWNSTSVEDGPGYNALWRIPIFIFALSVILLLYHVRGWYMPIVITAGIAFVIGLIISLAIFNSSQSYRNLMTFVATVKGKICPNIEFVE